MSQPAVVKQQMAAIKTPAYAWVVLFAVYLATLAAPLNQMKVPPVMSILIKTFGLDYGSAGMLMSIFSIMGFVLAIPAGFIMGRFGIKATGLIAVGATVIGAGIGALSNDANLLFAGRFVEGIGMGLIMVAAPSAISLWFPAEKRGLPMGLWASSVGVGSIAALNLAPALAQAHSWRAVWWVGTGLAALAFILFALLFRLPRQNELGGSAPQASAPQEGGKPAPVSLTKAMGNFSLWMIAITFGCFNLTVMAWNTFYPDFLETQRNFSPAYASFVTSLLMMIAIFSGPTGGYISDRIGSRKAVIIVPFIVLTVLFFLPFNITGWTIPALMILAGIVVGPVAPVCLAAVPEVMKSPQTIGIGLGVAAFCQNLGMFIGPALFGQLVEVTGFAMAGYLMVPICIAAIICTWLAKIR